MFTELAINGYSATNAIGAPKLPVNRKLIEFPIGATPEIIIHDYVVTEYDLAELGFQFPVMPAQPPAPKDGTYVPFEYDAAAYSTNEYTNTPLVEVEILGMMRGVKDVLGS